MGLGVESKLPRNHPIINLVVISTTNEAFETNHNSVANTDFAW